MFSKSKTLREVLRALEKSSILIETFDLPELSSYRTLVSNSQNVVEDSVFVCIIGYKFDGHTFAQDASRRGAKLLIVEKKLDVSLPQILVENTRMAAAILANLFFENPSSKVKLIGVTGTNGKTTISNLIYQILLRSNYKTGLIGTFGYSINNQHYSTQRTTPDIIDLNKILNEMINKDVEYVVMEVSSHAIALNRIFTLQFNAAIFTNLTQDHLDFHEDLNEYAKIKFRLFDYVEKCSGISLINIDDRFGKKLYNKLNKNKFSISFEQADYRIQNLQTDQTKNSFQLISNQIQCNIESNLIGKFNAFNLAAAIAIIKLMIPKISVNDLESKTNNLRSIPGRLEKIQNDRGIGLFIDYAHTPDALYNVLSTLAKLRKKRLICIFGAGGNRDKNKRPKMLQAALEFADLIVLTNDNPRDEDSAEIIRDILQSTRDMRNIVIIRDRKVAIQTTIKLSQKEDIVLIAGKGHETYQEIKGKKHHFDDKEEAIKSLQITKSSNELEIPLDPLLLERVFDQKLNNTSETLITDISTDSRRISPNSLFIALKGENYDGHDFVKEVLKKNCWTIVSNDHKCDDTSVINVSNTLEAYGKLASVYKSYFNLLSIGITGTYGKTTVKEYLANILNYDAAVLKTHANENNLIGLPKTIFKLNFKHRYGVFELGSNHFGEIKTLTKILNPDIGIITAIGPSHLKFLHDKDGIYKEKSSLFRTDLIQRFYPGDYTKFQEFKGKSFGYSKYDDYAISNVTADNGKTHFNINNISYTIQTPFIKYALNAAIAIAVCTEIGLNRTIIKNGVLKPLDNPMRMEIKKKKERILLIDCYNANPDSMKAAISFWNNYYPEKPHIAILGDMLELGKLTNYYHKKIWHQLKKIKNKKIISVGKYAKLFEASDHFDIVEDLLSSDIIDRFQENAVILIKASHGISLEKIIGRL